MKTIKVKNIYDNIPKNYTGIVEYSNGTKEWYLNDKLHRTDGPAVVWSNGTKEWYLNDKLHRVDGPAVEYHDGRKFWYLNGKRHREDGPAFEKLDGTKMYCLNGKFLNKNKIDQFINFWGYPEKTAIKLTYYLEGINK